MVFYRGSTFTALPTLDELQGVGVTTETFIHPTSLLHHAAGVSVLRPISASGCPLQS